VTKLNRQYQFLLMTSTVMLLIYAAWRFLNLLSSINAQGMIPQLWSPVISIAAEIALLLACILALVMLSNKAKWFAIVHAGLWLLLLLISLPVHIPLALDSRTVPMGQFSQAALSRQILVFHVVMSAIASLLAMGITDFIARRTKSSNDVH
jgi:hypothetical protein